MSQSQPIVYILSDSLGETADAGGEGRARAVPAGALPRRPPAAGSPHGVISGARRGSGGGRRRLPVHARRAEAARRDGGGRPSVGSDGRRHPRAGGHGARGRVGDEPRVGGRPDPHARTRLLRAHRGASSSPSSTTTAATRRSWRRPTIVLVGVSRTSKTPLAMYLAFKGYRVANVPLASEMEPPHQLFELDNRRRSSGSRRRPACSSRSARSAWRSSAPTRDATRTSNR